MSLKDDVIKMKQGDDYVEEDYSSDSNNSSTNTSSSTSSIFVNNDKKKKFSFKRNSDNEEETEGSKKIKVKLLLFVCIFIIFCIIFYFSYTYITKDRGASWLEEVEQEEYVFSYSIEERDLLRANGYTADDIERFEVEERNPQELVDEAVAERQAIYDAEIKPYLDGASPEFNKLKELTWLGTGDMSKEVLNSDSSYEERFGTYNCDYTKVPAYGLQLFLKLNLLDFDNKVIFMSVTPERYMELDESGNIVVVIEYNKYSDDSILVTDVYEKDIKR